MGGLQVEVIKTERHTPTWMKVTTAIGILALLLLILMFLRKLKVI